QYSPSNDVDARLLIDLLFVVELGDRKERHHDLLRQRKAGSVVESDVSAVGDDAIDEAERARLERRGGVAFVERLRDRLGVSGNEPIEDVVLVQRHHAKTPSGTSEILA